MMHFRNQSLEAAYIVPHKFQSRVVFYVHDPLIYSDDGKTL